MELSRPLAPALPSGPGLLVAGLPGSHFERPYFLGTGAPYGALQGAGARINFSQIGLGAG